MIITRSPLRISLGGGGTDLPSYYTRYGGFCVSAALDKYVYITLHRSFEKDFIIKYSRLERVADIASIEHPLIREALRLTGMAEPGLEIASMSDIPAGTGLGSSGSFTTALLLALHTLRKSLISPGEIAEEACHIEIDILGEPVGKQDQYIASHGGITAFDFAKNGTVTPRALSCSQETIANLEDHFLLFFTGYTRGAGTILKEQVEKTKSNDRALLESLHRVKEIGYESATLLERGDLRQFAELMHETWVMKRQRGGMTNPEIDTWYELARQNGAIGGKLIGAGGGGFLMFYAVDTLRLRHALREAGLQEVRWRLDFRGATVVAES